MPRYDLMFCWMSSTMRSAKGCLGCQHAVGRCWKLSCDSILWTSPIVLWSYFYCLCTVIIFSCCHKHKDVFGCLSLYSDKGATHSKGMFLLGPLFASNLVSAIQHRPLFEWWEVGAQEKGGIIRSSHAPFVGCSSILAAFPSCTEHMRPPQPP